MTIRGWARGVGFAALVASASGCGSSATLTLRDGREVESKILYGDAETVWVEGIEPWELKAAIGRGVVVEREDGKKVRGRFDAGSSVELSGPEENYLFATAWRQVCVQREGDAPGRPFCVPGPDVEVAEMAIAREDIADVDHPGTGAMIAGGVLLGLVGVVAIADFANPPPCASRSRPDGETNGGGGMPCFGPGFVTLMAGIVLGIPGLIIETDGVLTYFGSRSRYAQPETSPPPTRMYGAKGIRVGFEF